MNQVHTFRFHFLIQYLPQIWSSHSMHYGFFCELRGIYKPLKLTLHVCACTVTVFKEKSKYKQIIIKF